MIECNVQKRSNSGSGVFLKRHTGGSQRRCQMQHVSRSAQADSRSMQHVCRSTQPDSRSILICKHHSESAVSGPAQEEMIHFVRQWGGTLAWNAELPLPLPLQFDETSGGCRLGFVRVNDGAVQLVSTTLTLTFTVICTIICTVICTVVCTVMCTVMCTVISSCASY